MKRQLELWHLVVSLVVTVTGGSVSFGVMYGGIRKDIDHTANQALQVQQDIREIKDMVVEVRERVVRVETKMDDRRPQQ